MGSVSSEPGAPQRKGLIKQPLDLELPVVATGARPGDTSENRELFSEATETALVFENGCVIQLAAAVAVGQLIFLTNKQTGKEIVTQVLRKRSFRPTDCYVELEFTEASPMFWGVEFPEADASVSAAQQSGEAAAVAEAEPTEEDAGQAVPPPDAAEIDRLRREVEALKLQSKLTEQAKETEPKEEKADAATQHTEEHLSGMQEPSAGELAALKSLLDSKAPAREPVEEEEKPVAVEVPAAAANETKEETLAFPFRMQLPKADESAARGGEFAADATAIAALEAAEKQLPKPSLDFERFPGVSEPKTKLLSGKATRSLSGPIGAMVAAALFLIAAGIATYRMGWLPKFGGKSAKTPDSKSAFSEPKAGTGESPARVNATESETLPSGPVGGATANATPRNVDVPEEPVDVPNEKTAVRASVPATTEKRNVKKTATGKVSVGEPPPVVSKQDDVVVPPKLVKAIRSLSPPEALWKYVSGNVVLDAVVDETGHVASATVLSGPKALHKRAIDTVKEYLYQPATKNGKPVEAHVEVKIQFWYEP